MQPEDPPIIARTSMGGGIALTRDERERHVYIVGKSGKRSIPFFQLHKAPGDTPQIETILAPGDLISGFSIQGQWARSVYLKARDRQSYEFALASAAIALDVQDGCLVLV